MPSLAYYMLTALTAVSTRLMRPTPDLAGIRQLRRLYQTSNRAPRVRGVRVRPAMVAGVPAEWLIPANAQPDAALLYLHGGSFALGLTGVHRTLSAYLARETGLRTLSLDYRLAPEHPFPAALEDTLAAFGWLEAQGYAANRIVVAGESAGANLAVALALARKGRGLPLPGAIAAMSGVFDLSGVGASYRTAPDVMINPKFALAMATLYAAGHDPRDPLLSPIYGNLAGLPPVLLQVGAHERLLSDNEAFATAASAARVPVTLSIHPAMWHAWQVWVPYLPEATQAVREVAAFLRAALGTPSGAAGSNQRPGLTASLEKHTI